MRSRHLGRKAFLCIYMYNKQVSTEANTRQKQTFTLENHAGIVTVVVCISDYIGEKLYPIKNNLSFKQKSKLCAQFPNITFIFENAQPAITFGRRICSFCSKTKTVTLRFFRQIVLATFQNFVI